MAGDGFAQSAIWLAGQYPLLYMPVFIEDFVDGVASRDLARKYDLGGIEDVARMQKSVLKMSGKRHKVSDQSRQINLAIEGWQERYERARDGCAAVSVQLQESYHEALLAGLVALHLLKSEGAQGAAEVAGSMAGIARGALEWFAVRKDARITGPFEEYLGSLDGKGAEKILANLERGRHLSGAGAERLELSTSIGKIRGDIAGVLGRASAGIVYSDLYERVLARNPLLRIVPSVSLVESITGELESEGAVRRRPGYWAGRPYTDTLFASGAG